MKLIGAFSIRMMLEAFPANVRIEEVDSLTAGFAVTSDGGVTPSMKEVRESFISHPLMAKVISREWGIEIPTNKENTTLKVGESAILAQFTGILAVRFYRLTVVPTIVE